MTKVTSDGKFSTSFGMAFVVKDAPKLKVGDEITIDGKGYCIKRILLPTRPGNNDYITLFV